MTETEKIDDQRRAISNVYDKAQEFTDDWENDIDGDPVTAKRWRHTVQDIRTTEQLALRAPAMNASLRALLKELDAIGFDDPHADVRGTDCVDVICHHIGKLRNLVTEIP